MLLGLCAIKLHLLLLLPLFLLRRKLWKTIAGGAAVSAVWLALCFAAAGPGWFAKYRVALADSRANPYAANMVNLRGLFDYHSPWILPVAALVALLCGYLIWRGSLEVALCAVFAGGVLITPHTTVCDATLFLPSLLLARKMDWAPVARSGGLRAHSPLPFPPERRDAGGGVDDPCGGRMDGAPPGSGPGGKRDNGKVAALTFADARETVLRTVRHGRTLPAIEEIPLVEAAGRILAADAAADRDSPALARSVRDGYAVRAIDLPGRLEIIGEVRAGERFAGQLAAGQAVEIMTGAPIPSGADAVVMIEHTRRENGRVVIDGPAEAQQFINPRGCEAAAHQVVLHAGKRLDYADIALLASFGHARVKVYRRPVVAIVATGDEIVEIDEIPEEFQIRNSNAYSLAVQVARAGGVPQVLPVARDTR